jgi:hypothetical protein
MAEQVDDADPVFPSATSLPLSAAGGVSYPKDHQPGTLRPFAATLGVPSPAESKKHDTASTRNTTNNRTQTSEDGKMRTDTISDTATDS